MWLTVDGMINSFKLKQCVKHFSSKEVTCEGIINDVLYSNCFPLIVSIDNGN